nr:hypothetical protein [Streptomyces sp. WAC04770]
MQRLAEVLEERGDVEAAIAVYLIFDATPSCLRQVAVQLSEVLGRHGRSNEAIEVLRALTEHDAAGWLVHTLCTLYADHGRSREGLAHLDTIKARNDGKEYWDLFPMRLPLMAD